MPGTHLPGVHLCGYWSKVVFSPAHDPQYSKNVCMTYPNQLYLKCREFNGPTSNWYQPKVSAGTKLVSWWNHEYVTKRVGMSVRMSISVVKILANLVFTGSSRNDSVTHMIYRAVRGTGMVGIATLRDSQPNVYNQVLRFHIKTKGLS